MHSNKSPKKQFQFTFLKKIVNVSFKKYDDLKISCLIFKSIDDLNLIIYSQNNLIVCHNINTNQNVNIILNAHDKEITFLNNFSEKKNKINLVLSISSEDNNLKVWDISNFQCLYNFRNINSKGWINCGCFLNDNDQIYVLSTNSLGFSQNPEPIKVFDLKGKNIMNINDSNINIYYINVFYDNKSSTIYIITGSAGFSQSYNYNDNKVYHIYKGDNYRFHIKSIIKEKGDKVELIESSMDGNIKIWDFHSAVLLKNISCNSYCDMCLWESDYLLTCQKGKNRIKILDLNKKKDSCEFNFEKNNFIAISKIVHSEFGKCLVFQESYGFVLWKLEN